MHGHLEVRPVCAVSQIAEGKGTASAVPEAGSMPGSAPKEQRGPRRNWAAGCKPPGAHILRRDDRRPLEPDSMIKFAYLSCSPGSSQRPGYEPRF